MNAEFMAAFFSGLAIGISVTNLIYMYFGNA